jgi:hypothetical protein
VQSEALWAWGRGRLRGAQARAVAWARAGLAFASPGRKSEGCVETHVGTVSRVSRN